MAELGVEILEEKEREQGEDRGDGDRGSCELM